MISPTQAHRTFLRRCLAVAAVALMALSATGPAFGQSDTRELMNRLQRLENEMQTLNREVYRGGGSGASGAPTPSGAPTGNVAAGFEVRLQRLESEMQTLTGRYEEAAFQVGQLRDQLTKLQTDIDFRLSRLEQGQAGGLSATPPGLEGDKTTPAKGGKTTDLSPSPTAASADSVTGTLPTGSIQEQYDYAFNLLRQADYANAEKAFAQFLKTHPDNTLSSNAQYWMGETLYVRNKFKEAAVAFAEGYQKYPKSNKAPDSLLKLSLALSAMKANDDACAALGELTRNYKDAPATIKRRADQEKNRLKCS